jgi:hypothetical protein
MTERVKAVEVFLMDDETDDDLEPCAYVVPESTTLAQILTDEADWIAICPDMETAQRIADIWNRFGGN